MTSTRTVLRSALAAAALTLGALAATAPAHAASNAPALTAPVFTANYVQSDAGLAVQQVKFKKKFFSRKHHRSHNRGYNRYGHRQHGVAGVGHGRSLTGTSRFDRSGTYGRRGSHSERVIKKGVFPFGFVIVK